VSFLHNATVWRTHCVMGKPDWPLPPCGTRGRRSLYLSNYKTNYTLLWRINRRLHSSYYYKLTARRAIEHSIHIKLMTWKRYITKVNIIRTDFSCNTLGHMACSEYWNYESLYSWQGSNGAEAHCKAAIYTRDITLRKNAKHLTITLAHSHKSSRTARPKSL
jgi:hypothetical protein